MVARAVLVGLAGYVGWSYALAGLALAAYFVIHRLRASPPRTS